MADPVAVVNNSPPMVNGVNVVDGPIKENTGNTNPASNATSGVDAGKVVNGLDAGMVVSGGDAGKIVNGVDAVKVADGPQPAQATQPTLPAGGLKQPHLQP